MNSLNTTSIYESLGFNEFLQKLNSLPTQNSQYMSNVDIDTNFEAIGATLLNFGTIKQRIDIGLPDGGFIRIDGANKRIIINDGVVDRVLIGQQIGGF